MRKLFLFSVVHLILALGIVPVMVSAQSIVNVQAKQAGDSVIITYDLEGVKDPIIAQLYVSADGGKTFGEKPVKSVTGDVGEVKPGGNKKIYWNVLADQDYLQGNVTFRVKAESKFGYFTDKRDGTIYKTVSIGNQVWMAQNLNFFTDDKTCDCYNKRDKNCPLYGRYYEYKTAQTACPDGWHLPSKEEFEILIKKYPNAGQAYLDLISSGTSGFNSLNEGFMDDDRESGGLEAFSVYWTSTLYDANAAWRFTIGLHRRNAAMDRETNKYRHTIRCIKN